MEFGKLSSIEKVDWTLPAEDPLSLSFLQSLPTRKPPRFYLGTPAWGRKEWIGKIYPPKTKATDFLQFYARNFNTIELNTSHYRIPNEDQVQKWKAQITSDFIFCPKIYQGISHDPGGLKDQPLLKFWLSFLENLGSHCGPSFLQLPPHFSYARKAELFHFLQQWPQDFQLALEFRHESWFENGRILPALTQFLQSRKIGLVITDVAGRRDVLHSSVSSDFTILRFIGNDLHPSDFRRLHEWALRLKSWTERGLQRIFFFAHEPNDIHAPELADQVTAELNSICRADLKPLTWAHPPEQVSLGSL
jgi:uncharacterized protein YecE (DUF72 family)